MAEPLPHRPLTADDLYAMPDGDQKHELQAGVLVAEPLPGMRHGYVAGRICTLLGAHVHERRLGAVFGNDTGYVLARSPDTVRGPDVSFVSRERLEVVGVLGGPFPGAPDLAVEVLSPSNSAASVRAKVAEYLAAGTRVVWVVDPEARAVTVYRSLLAPRLLADEDVLDGEEIVPGFGVPVTALFSF